MRLSDVLNQELILLDEETEGVQDKNDLFNIMADKFKKENIISSKESFVKALLKREGLGSTYMGNGIAIPHGKSEEVKRSSISFCRLNKEIEYESYGEKGSVKMVFMFAIEESKAGTEYLKLLSSLARLLMKNDFIQELDESRDKQDVIEAFEKHGNALISI